MEVPDISELLIAAKAAYDARLAADRQAKLLKAEEDAAILALQNAMEGSGLDNLNLGKITATIEEKQKPYISDFNELEGYIREHGALDLLQRRLTEGAVKLRWEDGIRIPGVGVMTERKLKLR